MYPVESLLHNLLANTVVLRYTKPVVLKASTICRAVSRLRPSGGEPMLTKLTIGIPEVSTLSLDTVTSDRKATGEWNEALETAPHITPGLRKCAT